MPKHTSRWQQYNITPFTFLTSSHLLAFQIKYNNEIRRLNNWEIIIAVLSFKDDKPKQDEDGRKRLKMQAERINLRTFLKRDQEYVRIRMHAGIYLRCARGGWMNRRSLTRNIAIETTRTNDLESGEIPLHLTRTVCASTRSLGYCTYLDTDICGYPFVLSKVVS